MSIRTPKHGARPTSAFNHVHVTPAQVGDGEAELRENFGTDEPREALYDFLMERGYAHRDALGAILSFTRKQA